MRRPREYIRGPTRSAIKICATEGAGCGPPANASLDITNDALVRFGMPTSENDKVVARLGRIVDIRADDASNLVVSRAINIPFRNDRSKSTSICCCRKSTRDAQSVQIQSSWVSGPDEAPIFAHSCLLNFSDLERCLL